MSEMFFDNTEHIERDQGIEIDLAYKKLCEFEKNYCEKFNETSTGSIVYQVDSRRLLELENIPENKLKELDFSTVEYPSYEKLFTSKYKDRFLQNFSAIHPIELERELGQDTLNFLMKKDQEIKLKYVASVKDVDLDNDGVPDRIDIDDTKNSVQTVADLPIVKNTTSKETSRDHDKAKKRQNEMEL